MTLIDFDVLQRLQNDIDKELEFKKVEYYTDLTDIEKLRELLDELDRELRKAQAFVSTVHFLTKERILSTLYISDIKNCKNWTAKL